MDFKNTIVNDTADREIVISRTINASRELVFEAWTKPEHLGLWWGPTGFTNTFLDIDVRPGGMWRFIMHGPDGIDYPNRIVYNEVVKPERLVYTHGGEDENDPGQFQVIVTFDESYGSTLLTMRSIFPSAAERDKVVNEYSAIEGGNQTLDRLEELLANRSM